MEANSQPGCPSSRFPARDSLHDSELLACILLIVKFLWCCLAFDATADRFFDGALTCIGVGAGCHDGAAASELADLAAQESNLMWASDERRELCLSKEREVRRAKTVAMTAS